MPIAYSQSPFWEGNEFWGWAGAKNKFGGSLRAPEATCLSDSVLVVLV